MALRTLSLALCLGVTLTVSAWPGSGGDPSVEQAKKALEPLKMELATAQKKLDAEMTALRKSEDYKKAREARDFDKVRKLMGEIRDPFQKTWRERIQKASTSFEGKEGEILFAACLLENRLAAEPGETIRDLVNAHPKSPALLEITGNLRYLPRMLPDGEADPVIQKLIDENPSVEVQANAYYARAMGIGREPTAEQKKQAEMDLAKVVELMPADSILSMRARGPKFQETRLQIGMEVPDIEGVDLDGNAFKLSDYRGKVVMLDFWGDW